MHEMSYNVNRSMITILQQIKQMSIQYVNALSSVP